MLPFSGLTVETLEASKEAAISMSPFAVTCREKVFEAIKAKKEEGLTDEEQQLLLHMKANTQRPRRWELWKLGKIASSGQRSTQSGRNAAVWIAVSEDTNG